MKYHDMKNGLTITLTGEGDKANLVIEGKEQSIKLIVRRLEMYETQYHAAECAFLFGMDTTETTTTNRVKILFHATEAIKFLSKLSLISSDIGEMMMQYINPSEKKESSLGLLSGMLGNSISQIWHRKPVSRSDDTSVSLITSK